MIAGFIFFLVLGLTFIIGGVYLYLNDKKCLGIMSSIFGVTVLTLSITIFSIYNSNKSRVNALVESGKYEIVTHDDYSLNELKQFKNVGDVYLKEIE